MDTDFALEQAVRLVGHAHRTGQAPRSERWFADDAWWEREAQEAMAAERVAQADLIRDIFTNPFRVTPLAANEWLKWRGGVVPQIAQDIYETERFANLPVLADALEDAGCNDHDLLAHLRSSGPHVRGCWAVDLLLGRA